MSEADIRADLRALTRKVDKVLDRVGRLEGKATMWGAIAGFIMGMVPIALREWLSKP